MSDPPLLLTGGGVKCEDRGAMDSLFDASLFDAPVVAVVVDPPEPDLSAPDDAAVDGLSEPVQSAGVAPGAPVDSNSDSGADFGADTGASDDTIVELPADGDITEVLNDPEWEPPLDEITEVGRDPGWDPATEDLNDGGADFWSEVIGQDAAVSLLRASVATPVHAYLFVGAAGSGKLGAALRFGAALVCPHGGCGSCNTCDRALLQTHPDVLVVEREGASISVDQAREIIRLAARAPMEGDRKVLILVDFHLVTQAAPTLLKIIEEPPPSTVFVVLAEQVTAELVTIASRCVTVGFAALSVDAIARVLADEGAPPEVATKVAAASGGRLDRARLLATDPQLGQRLSFWQMVPSRLDGTGAAVSVLAADAVAMLDAAAVGPLEARQAAELATLEARLDASGGRGGTGQRKELLERHKRELKRLRDDEVRLGLGAIQQVYRGVLSDPSATAADIGSSLLAIDRVNRANEHLVRNPNLTLLLQALLIDLPRR